MVLGIQATNYLCMTSWSWIMIPDYLFKEAATSGPLQDYGYVLISRSLPRRWYHHHFTFKHRRRRCQGGGEGKIMEWGALTRRSLTSHETSEGGLVRDIKVIMFGYLDILWWTILTMIGILATMMSWPNFNFGDFTQPKNCEISNSVNSKAHSKESSTACKVTIIPTCNCYECILACGSQTRVLIVWRLKCAAETYRSKSLF